MGKLKIEGYELRDVAVMQAPVSFCNHRGDVNPFVTICDREVYPIFVAPMASVTDQHNYKTWIDNKLTPVVPRSVQKSENNPNGLSFEERMELSHETFVSISLKEAQTDLIDYLSFNAGWDKYYICIDIAHGTLSELYDICKKIKSMYGDTVEIMTGNVANPAAYSFYADAGISWVRCGIGGGSRCLKEGTKITMADESKMNIEDISRGDYVMTMNGPCKVLNTFSKETRSSVIINNSIECTPNHKLFVVKKSLLPQNKSDITDNFIRENGEFIEASKLNSNYLLVEG